jgi:chromosome segregation ATPase
MRADELQAISKATDALEEGVKPNYGANAKLVGFVQKSAAPKPATVKPASFIQLRRSGSTSASQAMKQVLDLLKSKATVLKSQELAAIALRVSMQEDHFVKVRQMLKDLIAKLKADAEAEAEQKGFCDKGMMEATTARDEAKMTIESKTADISKNEAEKAELLEDISNLQKAIAENKKAINEATELRNKEHSDNEKTLADADAGKEAVTFALTTLKEFYEGAAFVQVKYTPPVTDSSGNNFADMAPKGVSGSYSGNQQQSKGIIGMLEVILSDFERTLDTTKSSEDDAQSKFETFESETEADSKAKQDDVDAKKGRVAEIEDALMTLEDENSDAQTKLDGALSELEKLKPMCVSGGETYAERVAAREQEIAALKEAMQMLIDWQAFLV